MPKWVPVRDKTTGHVFDLDERSLAAFGDGIEVVKNEEPIEGPGAQPRPPRYSTSKAGAPAESTKEKR